MTQSASTAADAQSASTTADAQSTLTFEDAMAALALASGPHYVIPPAAAAKFEKKFRMKAALQDSCARLETAIRDYVELSAQYNATDDKPDPGFVNHTVYSLVRSITNTCGSAKPCPQPDPQIFREERVKFTPFIPKAVSAAEGLDNFDNVLDLLPADVHDNTPTTRPTVVPLSSSPHLAVTPKTEAVPANATSSTVGANVATLSPCPAITPAPPVNLDPKVFFILRHVVPDSNEIPYYPSDTRPIIECDNWHCIIVGSAVGVVADWTNAAPYVSGVSGNVSKGYKNCRLACERFWSAVATGGVKIVS